MRAVHPSFHHSTIPWLIRSCTVAPARFRRYLGGMGGFGGTSGGIEGICEMMNVRRSRTNRLIPSRRPSPKPSAMRAADASHVFPGRGKSWWLGRRQISVAPDGRLYPCVQFVGREGYCIGTAERGIDEAKREAIYATNEQDKAQCAGCALAARCHNKCGCLNIQTTGCLTSIPALLCEHERMACALEPPRVSALGDGRLPGYRGVLSSMPIVLLATS